MSNLIEAAPEESGGGAGGSNRAYLLIALGLASLLVVGLILIFGYVAGSRLGFFGTRAFSSPDSSAFLSGPAGTATALALAGTISPADVTRSPTAATSVAGTVTAGALAAGGTRVSAAPAAGSPVAGAAATARTASTSATTATSTPTHVVGALVLTPSPAATTNAASVPANTATTTPTRVVVDLAVTPSAAATNASTAVGVQTPALGNTPAPANTPGGALSGSSLDAKATPARAGSGLPSTGVELDILVAGLVLVLLLMVARVIRMALRH